MLFAKNTELQITTCDICKGAGYLGIHKCSTCATMSMGRHVRGKWLYFGQPLTRYHIALRKSREWLFRIEILSALLLALLLWVFFIARLYSTNRLDIFFSQAYLYFLTLIGW